MPDYPDPTQELADELNDDDRFSALKTVIGEDAPDGARGRIRVHPAGAFAQDDEWVETLDDVARDFYQPTRVTERNASTADVWLYAAE